jgi:hypothetical protein
MLTITPPMRLQILCRIKYVLVYHKYVNMIENLPETQVKLMDDAKYLFH